MNQYPYTNPNEQGQGVPSQPGYTQGYEPVAYPAQPYGSYLGTPPQPPVQPQQVYPPVYGSAPQPPHQPPHWSIPQAVNPPQQGYALPVYPPQQGYYVPMGYPAAVYVPPFALRQEKDPAVKQASKTLNRLCFVMLMQVAVGALLSYILMMVTVFWMNDVLYSDMGFQWLNTALVPLSTALPFLVYLRIGHKDTTEYLRFEKVGFFTALLCVLAGLGLCLLGNYPAFAIQDFFSQFGYEPTASFAPAGRQTMQMFALELFSTAMLVPVMEEFAFRGVLLSALRKYGGGFAVIASALVFAFAHGDFSNVVFAFFAGLVFGFLYVRTGNLWISVCIHALNNGIAVLGSYSDFLFGKSAEYLIQDLTMVIPLALGGLALLLLLLFRREALQRKPQPDGACVLSTGGSVAAIVRAPLFWVLFSFVVFYTANLFF